MANPPHVRLVRFSLQNHVGRVMSDSPHLPVLLLGQLALEAVIALVHEPGDEMDQGGSPVVAAAPTARLGRVAVFHVAHDAAAGVTPRGEAVATPVPLSKFPPSPPVLDSSAAFAKRVQLVLGAAGAPVSVTHLPADPALCGAAVAAADADPSVCGIIVCQPLPSPCTPVLALISPAKDLDGAWAGPWGGGRGEYGVAGAGEPGPATPISSSCHFAPAAGQGPAVALMTPGMAMVPPVVRMPSPVTPVGATTVGVATLVCMLFRPHVDAVAIVGYKGRIGSAVGGFDSSSSPRPRHQARQWLCTRSLPSQAFPTVASVCMRSHRPGPDRSRRTVEGLWAGGVWCGWWAVGPLVVLQLHRGDRSGQGRHAGRRGLGASRA